MQRKLTPRMLIFDGPDVHKAGVHVTVGGQEAGVPGHGAVDTALRIEDDLYGRSHLRQLVPQDLADFLVRFDVEQASRLIV